MIQFRPLFLSLVLLLSTGAGTSKADDFAAAYAPVALQMQKTCVDYVLRKVNDGSTLSKVGLVATRKSKRKVVYKGKADLGGTFNIVYSAELAENNRGVRGCRAMAIRTDYDSARRVMGALLHDLEQQGGRLVAQPPGGFYSVYRFAFGQIVQAKASFASNSLIVDYYLKG